MIRRIPILPTLLVVAAALLMVRLGIWQLARAHEKDAARERHAANQHKPLLPFAALWPVKEADLYRRASVTCIAVTGWTSSAGRTAAGVTGWRHLAGCRTGAEGPGVIVDMGVSQSATAPAWRGGRVAGPLVWAPRGESLLSHLIAPAAPETPLIVSEVPAAGLAATAPPNPADVPNNSLSYAVQWFLFAALALVIYALALWKRQRARP